MHGLPIGRLLVTRACRMGALQVTVHHRNLLLRPLYLPFLLNPYFKFLVFIAVSSCRLTKATYYFGTSWGRSSRTVCGVWSMAVLDPSFFLLPGPPMSLVTTFLA